MVNEWNINKTFYLETFYVFRVLTFFIATFTLSACEGLKTATITGQFHPGITGGNVATGPFTQSWPFDFTTTASYAYDTTKIDFTGGVCRLSPNDQIDDANNASGFAGGTLTGATWDSTNGYIRLTQSGTPTNNSKLDSSWAPQRSSLVGLWHLDEVVGSTVATDDSGNGLSGTIGSTVTLGNPGKVNGSASFDSTATSFIQTANTTSLNPTTALTIHAWVYPSNAGNSNAGIANKGPFNGSQGSFSLGLAEVLGAQGLIFWIDYPSGQLTAPTLNRGEWSHVVATYDGSTMKLYTNGILKNSASYTGNITSANTPYILGAYYGSSNVFNGQVDEIAIWNTSLSATEIQTIYSRQYAKYSGTFTSRVMDAFQAGMSWTTLSWIPTLPFMKKLPDYASGAIQNETSTDYSSLVGSTGVVGDNNLMSGIVGLWHLDEASGTAGAGSVKDTANPSGSAYNGTPTSITFGSNGQLGSSINISGAGGIDFGDISAANYGAGDFSAQAWIKTSSPPGAYMYVLGKREAGCAHGSFFNISVRSTGKVFVEVDENGAGLNYNAVTGNITVTDGSWKHIVMTRVGANVKIYVNGILDQQNTGPGTASISNTASFQVGSALCSDAGNGFVPFTGSIDEVATWSRALHANEVKQLYRRGANRIKYQVRVCTTANAGLTDCTDDPTGANWKGPDGTNQTYFSELNNNTVALDGSGDVKKGLPSMLFSAFTSPVGTSRYFQYRTILESDDTGTECNYGSGTTWCSPELKSVTVDPVHYDSSAPTVIGQTGVSYDSIATFSETIQTSACPSGVGYNLGVGALYSSAIWYYWNGSTWITANGTVAQSNTAAVISTNAASFKDVAGTGTVFFKAYLKSYGITRCELDQLILTGQQ